ncbi:8022_t:CDS:2 [Entrophospora sp. SA101]|nr:15089_t:CDS:2 [Entrophospora sp. SA101]CAJ0845133.1 8022_t:CDS:2 [Entrophospora sp. SA101]
MKEAKRLKREGKIKESFDLKKSSPNSLLTPLLKNKTGDSQLENHPCEVDHYLADKEEKLTKLQEEINEIEEELRNNNLAGTDLEEELQRKNNLQARKDKFKKELERNPVGRYLATLAYIFLSSYLISQIFPRDQIMLLRVHSETEENRNKGLKLLEKFSPVYYTVYQKKGDKEEPKALPSQTKIRQIITSIKETKHFCQAFIHSSFCHEKNLPASASYENLEFFGDSVLNFYTSQYIFLSFPHFTEGQLSKLKQLMVQESTLAHLSKEIGLNEFLQLGIGERKNHGMEKNSILADIFESFVAALYLEKGGKFVYRFLELTLFAWIKDYKSQLQEYCQAQKNEVSYQLKGIKKIDHQQLFIMEARDRLRTFCEKGTGKSKKEAEQEAAEKKNLDLELKFWKEYPLIAGVDEAGRGALAGPIIVATVILPTNFQNPLIQDSKILSPSQRKRAYRIVKKEALEYNIITKSAREVEDKNPLGATKEAMIEAILNLKNKPDLSLIDGKEEIMVEGIKTISIIGGDRQSINIAAASILAKGYPNKTHLTALFRYGICDLHRKTYEPIKSLIKPDCDKKKL